MISRKTSDFSKEMSNFYLDGNELTRKIPTKIETFRVK